MSDAGERTAPPVVTLFETYGSGAEYIGARVADSLGLPFHEQAFSSAQLEESAQLREKEGLLARALSAMGQSSFGGLDVGDVSGGQRDSYQLVMENTGTVLRWAREGGLIVGRNGAFILSGADGTARQARRPPMSPVESPSTLENAARPHLPIPRILGYACGDAGCNIAFQMTGLFLLVFYTDVVGIDPVHAGNILLFVKIWDAFADLFAGRMVDRTMTRWGKF